VARYPGRVKTLVAHEPPCMRLLRETGEDDKFSQCSPGTYRAAGVGAAMQKFAEGAGLGPGRGAERKTLHRRSLRRLSRAPRAMRSFSSNMA